LTKILQPETNHILTASGDIPPEFRPLNTDFSYFHRLLECPTCLFVKYATLFRAPCCSNETRPHFADSGHNAEDHGKCPSWKKGNPKVITAFIEGNKEVWNYGKD